MEEAANLRDFLRAPVGRYLAGRTWVYFYADTHFSGCILWGRVETEDVREAVKISPRVHDFAQKPHVAMIDVRRVEHVELTVFGVLHEYLDASRQALRNVSERLAIVRPSGVVGTLAGGFFHVVRPPYPIQTFAEPDAALRWLGVERPHDRMTELDALHARLAKEPLFLRQLRTLIAEKVGTGIELPVAARHLGVSPRSLQRRLTEVGTSFQAELVDARIAAAKRLLVDTDANLTRIAFEIGCASPHHFSTLFRKQTGETPSGWRTRRKNG